MSQRQNQRLGITPLKRKRANKPSSAAEAQHQVKRMKQPSVMIDLPLKPSLHHGMRAWRSRTGRVMGNIWDMCCAHVLAFLDVQDLLLVASGTASKVVDGDGRLVLDKDRKPQLDITTRCIKELVRVKIERKIKKHMDTASGMAVEQTRADRHNEMVHHLEAAVDHEDWVHQLFADCVATCVVGTGVMSAWRQDGDALDNHFLHLFGRHRHWHMYHASGLSANGLQEFCNVLMILPRYGAFTRECAHELAGKWTDWTNAFVPLQWILGHYREFWCKFNILADFPPCNWKPVMKHALQTCIVLCIAFDHFAMFQWLLEFDLPFQMEYVTECVRFDRRNMLDYLRGKFSFRPTMEQTQLAQSADQLMFLLERKFPVGRDMVF